MNCRINREAVFKDEISFTNDIFRKRFACRVLVLGKNV